MVYCQAWAAWLGAIQYIEQYGSVIKTPNGHLQQSPYVSIANNNAEVVLRIAQQFSFTPGSRGRIWMVGSAPDSGRLELEENGFAPWGQKNTLSQGSEEVLALVKKLVTSE